MTLIVIKVGGDILKDDAVVAVATDVASAGARGDRVLMVHGGGPQATALQRALGQQPNVVAGRRITDGAALDVMKMAVAGKLNVDLCSALIAANARPIGLHGASSLAIEAKVRPPRIVSGGGPDPIDFGHVGDVIGLNIDLIERLFAGKYVPVLACLGCDADGRVLNINADIIANQAAKHLGADHLVLVTGTSGVLRDIDDPTSRIERLTVAQARQAIEDETVTGGMIPKLEESMRILGAGVGSVHIVGKLGAGDLLREIDAPGSVGTALLP